MSVGSEESRPGSRSWNQWDVALLVGLHRLEPCLQAAPANTVRDASNKQLLQTTTLSMCGASGGCISPSSSPGVHHKAGN